MKRVFLVLLGMFFLAGCASGYEKFYQPIPVRPSAGFAPFSENPQLVYGNSDAKTTVARMYERGYAAIGISAFVGPAANPSEAIDQARKVGAAVVVVTSKYQNTVSGALPLTLPNNTTSFSSGTAHLSGPGGFASGTYSGVTTTYGTQTTYVPYSIDRYQQAAIYFAPLNRRGLGILVTEISNEQKQQLGSNKAVVVMAVRKSSPAFMADILPGDMILSINGNSLYDIDSAAQAMNDTAGKTNVVVLTRNATRIIKNVVVPAVDW